MMEGGWARQGTGRTHERGRARAAQERRVQTARLLSPGDDANPSGDTMGVVARKNGGELGSFLHPGNRHSRGGALVSWSRRSPRQHKLASQARRHSVLAGVVPAGMMLLLQMQRGARALGPLERSGREGRGGASTAAVGE